MPRQKSRNLSPSYENLYNNSAERYVLGSIIIDNTVMNSLTGKLYEEDFYNEDNRKVFSAMLSLYRNDSKIELLLVAEELIRLDLNLTMDSKEFLLSLVDEVPTVANVDTYINIVKDKSVERKLHQYLADLNADLLNGSLSFNQILDKAEDTVLELIKNRRTSELLTIADAASQVYTQIETYTHSEGDIKGIPTGYPALDKATLGFQKGNLIILAARPSVGKSAFALNLAVNACRGTNYHVALFSLEMSIEQLMMRLYAYESGIPSTKIQSGNLNETEMIQLGHAKLNLSKYNIYFGESNETKIPEIRAKCRQLKQQGRLDMVIIDYLQLISSDSGGSRQEVVAEISRSLKILSKELNIPIIALSQTSRSQEQREDKKPVLSDLRESGSIEQDADIVMFLHRPEDAKKNKYKEIEVVETAKLEMDTKEKQIQLIIAKNRQGALRDIMFNFFPAESRFRENKYALKEKEEKDNN